MHFEAIIIIFIIHLNALCGIIIKTKCPIGQPHSLLNNIVLENGMYPPIFLCISKSLLQSEENALS